MAFSILSRASGAILIAQILGGPAVGDTQGSSPTGSVDPFSGSFTTSVPITAPEFRGLTPGLRLTYNSSGGNGWIGVGWSMSGISYIHRRGPNEGMPTYGATDKLFLDGAELVPCTTQEGTHCTYIQNYARIIDEGDGTWTVRGTNGYLATYEPLVATASGTSRWAITSIEDPNGNQVLFDYWCDGGTYPDDCYPDSISYGGGAEILFHSELRPDVLEAGNGVSFTVSRYRLKSIEVRAGGPQETVRVYQLTYAQSADSGRSLVTDVQQFGRGTEVLADGSVNAATWPGPPFLPPMTFGFPSTGEFPDDGGSGTFSIPCTPASWPPHDPDGCPVVQSPKDIPPTHVREKSTFGDFNGDGRMDSFLWTPGFFHIALAAGSPEAPVHEITAPWQQVPWGQPAIDDCLSIDQPVQSFNAADVNADGRADIVQLCSANGNNVQIKVQSWINQLNGAFSHVSSFVPKTTAPNEPANFDIDLSTRMPVDVDGDGNVDIVVIERKPNAGGDVRIRVGRGNGDGTFTWTYDDYSGLWWSSDTDNHIVWTPGDFNGDGRIDFASLYEHPSTNTIYAQYALANDDPNLTFSTGQQPTGLSNYDNDATWSPVRMTVTPVDMNGDGLTDVTAVVDVVAGSTLFKVDVIVLLSRGGGTAMFDVDRDTILNMSRTAEQYLFLHPTVAVGDLNADGIAEILLEYFDYNPTYPDPQDRLLTLFRRHDGTYAPRASEGTLGMATMFRSTATAIADSSGDGVGDLLMIRQQDQLAGQPRATNFASYVSLAEADLVVTLDNGIGGTSEIEYVPSAEWITGDPDVDQYLPPGFSTPTVEAVTTLDGRANSGTATYTYEGALWSLAERQFMGFRRVRTVVGGTDSWQETVYYQREGTIAKPEQTTLYDDANNIITATRHIYTEDDDGLPPFTSLLSERVDYECNGASTLEGCRVVLTQFGYDQYGNVTEIIEHGVHPNEGEGLGDERTTVRVYPENSESYIVGLPLKETIYKGLDTSTMFPNAQQQTSWSYDAHGNRVSEAQLVSYAPTAYWRFWQYDGDGNVIWEKDFLGAVTTTVYDPTFNLFPIQRCNALGHCSSYAWDTVIAQRTSDADPNGLVLEYEYDGMGRVELITRSDGGAPTYYTYWGTEFGKAHGEYWTIVFQDGLGREYKRIREGGATKVTTYQNTLTRPWKESLWFGPEETEETAPYIEYSYDEAGRPRIVTNPDGTESETQYGLGFRDVIDELDHKRRIWTDGLGRVTQVREYDGTNELDTTYSYDAVDRMIQSVDHLGHVSQHLWSLVGQKVISCTPGTGCWLYGYNAPGLVTTQIDARNQTVSYTYDALGRIKTKNVSGVGVSTWFYDEPNHGAAVGSVTRITFPGGSESYNYDLAGNNTLTTRCVDTVCKTTSAMYDASDRPWLIQYPDSQQVLYSYDAEGRLASVGGYLGAVGGPVYVDDMEWSTTGKLKSITYGNGAVSTYEYDENREWLDEATVKDGSGATLFRGVYTYDAAARVDLMDVTRQSAGPEQWDYGYDALNRLTSLLAANAPDEDYQYDEVGNMKRKGSLSSPLYEYNDPAKPFAVTRIGTTKYTYDAVGNRIAKGTCDQAECTTSTNQATYAFDADGRMTSFTNIALGQTTTYGYGPGEARVRISSPGGTRRIFGELYETTGSGGNDGVSYVYAGPIRVAMKDASGTYYYHHDHLGSVRVVTNQSGAVAATNDFMPFGERVNPTGSAGANPFDFAGHRTDAESGLVYMKARYYDPVIARFISPDRIVPDVMNPQSLNPYAYANNNPISNVDPTGHSPQGLIMMFSFVLSMFSPQMNPMLAAVVMVGMYMTTAGMALQNPVLSSVGSILLGFAGGYTLGNGSNYLGGVMGASAAGLSSPVSPLSAQAKMAVAWTWTANGLLAPATQDLAQRVQAQRQLMANARADASQMGGTSQVGVGDSGVTLVARPLQYTDAFNHSSLFVTDPETGEIVRQYSLQGEATEFDPQLSELAPGESPSSTFTADRNAFLNPGGKNQHFNIAPPAGVTAKAFREQVIQLGDSYSAVRYSNIIGPNSNSAAAFPLYRAGAQVPHISRTPFLHYYRPK